MKGQGGRTIQSTPRGPVRKTWQTSETIPLATRSLLRGSFVSTCQRTPLFQPKKRCKDNTKKVSQILYLCRRGAYKNIGRRGIKLLDEGIKRCIKQETSRPKKKLATDYKSAANAHYSFNQTSNIIPFFKASFLRISIKISTISQ